MEKESKQFLHDLLKTPSPTSFESGIQNIVKKRMAKYADSIDKDYHGNLIVGLNTSAKLRVMLAGHCDQIGFMVSHITNEGFIYLQALGGIDVGVLHGSVVQIHSKKGMVTGVFGRKPIHLQTADERTNLKLELDKVWVDIGAKSKKEALKRIEIGDPATFELRIHEFGNDFVCSPGLDDKTGLFVAMEALRLCAESKIKVALFAVSTVQEEVGLRGAKTAAYSVDPHVGIAIDVAHATDNPGHDNKKSPPCVLGKGPGIVKGVNVNPVVEELLVKTAKKKKIPYQLAPISVPLGNDANVIQVSKGGVAAAAIQIPNRYMHTQAEICHYKDLENAAKLLAEFIKGLDSKSDFRP